MYHKPTISVIMSVYNGSGEYLIDAIESILNQTYTDFEFLIFDDGCVQAIKNILVYYADLDKRIKLFSNCENVGLTKNLHLGVKLSNGRYICRQDADDLSIKTRFYEQVKYMDDHLDIGMSCTAFFLDIEGKRKKRSIGFRSSEGIKARLFMENSHIMHGSVIMRKSFLIENDINYNEEILKSQDYEMWVRISRLGKIGILPKYLCVYRCSHNQISTNAITAKQQREFFKVIVTNQVSHIMPSITKKQLETHLCLALGEPREKNYKVLLWILELLQNDNIKKEYKYKYILLVIFKKYTVYFLKRTKLSLKHIFAVSSICSIVADRLLNMVRNNQKNGI